MKPEKERAIGLQTCSCARPHPVPWRCPFLHQTRTVGHPLFFRRLAAVREAITAAC
jgi:hypothetical protein